MIEQAQAHLLQSTLFAALAAVLAFVLRNNRAQTRHWIWLSASVKFLVPFSWLLAAGSQLSWLLPAERVHGYSEFFNQFDQTPAGAASTMPPSPHLLAWAPLTAILAAVWFTGFAVVLVSWVWRWRGVSAALRSATPLNAGDAHETLRRLRAKIGVRSRIELMSTRSLLEPGVVGVMRPVLLLPSGISECLRPAQLEAILAHEIVHVRRRDNLSAAVHMFVEAVFWFHPLVWWLGAKLVTERERACDEEVLRLGSESETYAEGILRVCKFSIASPLACVSGITGPDLKKRIEEIMRPHPNKRMNLAERFLPVSLGLLTLAAPLFVGLLSAPRGVAQSETPSAGRPAFEIASVKPSGPGEFMKVQFAPGGRFSGANLSLRFLIKIAYDLRDDQIGGGPNWLGSKHYDVEAKCDPPIAGDPHNMTEAEKKAYFAQMRLRLQSLLADRFQLKLRMGTKELAIYELEVAKNGSKLKEADADAGDAGRMKFGPGQLEATSLDMEGFANMLSEQVGRTVLDRTGLKGRYSFKLEWAPDPLPGGRPGGMVPLGEPPPGSPSNDARPSDTSGPSLFTSLQEQLGLKLVSGKGQAPFATVEAAQLPSEN